MMTMAWKTGRRGLALVGAVILLAGCAMQQPAPYAPAPHGPGTVAPYEPAPPYAPAPRAGYAHPQVGIGGSVRYHRRGSYIGYSYPGSYRYRPTLGDTILGSMTGYDR